MQGLTPEDVGDSESNHNPRTVHCITILYAESLESTSLVRTQDIRFYALSFSDKI